MFEYLYEWLQNIAFYLVLITAVMHIIPNNTYTKYIRFFTGLVLVVMLTGSILKVFGMEQKFTEIYVSEEYKQKRREIEEATKYLENVSLEEELNGITEVEEIRIGE